MVPLFLLQEFLHYAVGGILVFIASIVASVKSYDISGLIAGSVSVLYSSCAANCPGKHTKPSCVGKRKIEMCIQGHMVSFTSRTNRMLTLLKLTHIHPNKCNYRYNTELDVLINQRYCCTANQITTVMTKTLLCVSV